jgi:hypothetical protein
MDENMAEKLKSMLDDPNTMNMLSNLLGNMKSSSQNAQTSGNLQDGDITENANSVQGGSDSADIMMKIKDVMSSVSADSDPRINLLHSLKPYMRPARSEKMEQAIKLIQIAKIASVFKL